MTEEIIIEPRLVRLIRRSTNHHRLPRQRQHAVGPVSHSDVSPSVRREANPPDDPSLNPTPICIAGSASCYLPIAILPPSFETLSLLYQALQKLSSPSKGHIISNIRWEINLPFMQLVARVNSAWGSELGLKRTRLRNEAPTSFYLLCCIHGGKSRGASKCRNLIRGTIRRHSADCASRTSTWLPSFSRHLSGDPLVKEASVCAAAQMQPLLENALKCRTRRAEPKTRYASSSL